MTFTIVFDLDGTLVDTAPDLMAVANAMLAEMGAPPLDEETGRVAAGQGARALLGAGLSAAGMPLPPEARWSDLIAEFIARYDARIAHESRPFPGMEAFLEDMRAHGFRLSVCTNKKDFLAESLLESLGLRGFFDAVVGGNTLGCGKPDPRPLAHAVQSAGGDPARAAIIGDSLSDVLAARALDMPAILAAWGYLDRPASAYCADFVIDTIADAHALLEQLLPERRVQAP